MGQGRAKCQGIRFERPSIHGRNTQCDAALIDGAVGSITIDYNCTANQFQRH